jgi:hypothetical protein
MVPGALSLWFAATGCGRLHNHGPALPDQTLGAGAAGISSGRRRRNLA